MSDFLQQCRREWERLGVPDAVANEMAADLAADLADAQAEGVSAEEVLGTGVFDPRAFAAAWASERGVIPAAPGPRDVSRKPLVLVGLATFMVIGLLGTAMIALRLHTTSMAVAREPQGLLAFPTPPRGFGMHGLSLAEQALPWILVLVVATLAAIAAAWLGSRRQRRVA